MPSESKSVKELKLTLAKTLKITSNPVLNRSRLADQGIVHGLGSAYLGHHRRGIFPFAVRGIAPSGLMFS